MCFFSWEKKKIFKIHKLAIKKHIYHHYHLVDQCMVCRFSLFLFCFIDVFAHDKNHVFVTFFNVFFLLKKKKFKIQRKSVFLPKKIDSIRFHCAILRFSSSSSPVELNNVSLEKVKTKKKEEFQKNFECEFFFVRSFVLHHQVFSTE